MALQLKALRWDKRATTEGPKPLVEGVVFDGYQFGIRFTHFEGVNLILKADPYQGRYVPTAGHPYYRYWRFTKQALYEHGEDLLRVLLDAGQEQVVETLPAFYQKLASARAAVQPHAFAHDLSATVYQIESGGAVIVSTFHPAVVALAQSMRGRYLSPMRAWKIADATPFMVRENLLRALKLREDQVTIAEGLFGIVDNAFVPQGNDGATIKVLPSAIPDAVMSAEDHDNEVYLAVTSPLAATPYSAADIETLIGKYQLYDYQRDGVRHLVKASSSLLADDMGLGKTRQAVCAADILSGLDAGKQILIACPSDLIINWAREIAMVIPGEKSISQGKYHPEKRWIIVNYEMLHTVVALASKFAVMVVDEAHLLKEPTSLRTRLAFDIAANVPYRAILTGTPILNRESELHTLLRLSGHPLGKIPLKQFQEQFSGDPAFRLELNKRIAEWMLYRTKDQVLKHLKGKKRQARYVELTEADRERYDAINMDGGIPTLAKIGRLRQELEACKVRSVVDMLTTLNGDDKVIVFCEFTDSVALFSEALDAAGIGHCVLTGAIKSRKRRQEIIDEFQQDPLKRVFVATRAAGGVGHNITAANYVVLVSLPWTPGLAAQAEDRAYRNGQERLVIVRIMLAENTIDMDVVAMHKSKKTIAAEILDPEEAERLALAEFAEGFDRKAA